MTFFMLNILQQSLHKEKEKYKPHTKFKNLKPRDNADTGGGQKPKQRSQAFFFVISLSCDFIKIWTASKSKPNLYILRTKRLETRRGKKKEKIS